MPRRTDPRDPLNRLEHLIGLGFWAVFVKLEQLEQQVALLTQQEETEMASLDALTAEVAENTDAVNSASALLSRLAEELRNAANDPAAIEALAAQLDANNTALSEAVTANTPAG